MKRNPLHLYRLSLNLKAVHIQCLDQNKSALKGGYASGFIIQEEEDFFLCTCWHVVTGFDMHNIEIKGILPQRKYLRVNIQGFEVRQPGLQVIGGNQFVELPLYDDKNRPLWIQNKQDTPHYELNEINLKVPFWHDMIKLKLPKNLAISEMQFIGKEDILLNHGLLGEKIYIVGYPYGYSAFGVEQPTAIVIARHIASDRIKGRHAEVLIDGPATPGMSGGPVFIERDQRLLLLGIYTGLLYPDFEIEQNEKTTALGTISNLVLWWQIENE